MNRAIFYLNSASTQKPLTRVGTAQIPLYAMIDYEEDDEKESE